MRQIVLDTETTGLSTAEGHRIIEIGAIELNSRKFTGKTFHYYINPEREIDPGAQAVHGITSEFLQDKPLFNEIVTEFMGFIQGAELIIHNAEFDAGFINHEFNLLNRDLKKIADYCTVTCTWVMARARHAGQKNSLDALCKRYNIDNSGRDLHGALVDADLLAKVYLAMTGGQKSLFGDEAFETYSDFQTEKNKSLTKQDLNYSNKLIIVRATDEELALHEARMAELKTLA